MELAVIDAQNAVQIFTGGGLEAILSGIEAKVRAMRFDISTEAGRGELRSVAYQVARTKVALDEEGKRLTENWRAQTKKVNEERQRGRDRLEALAEEVRKPLTEFENREKLRVAAHEEALKDITGLHAQIAACPDMSVAYLQTLLIDLEKSNADRQWEEFTFRADAARSDAKKYILKRIEERTKLDAERAELARLKKEEADRLQRERDERIAVEAAENARLAAEQAARYEAEKERNRVAAEAERVRLEYERVQREAEAKAQAERDRLAAEARAAEDKRQAEERARIVAENRAKDAENARIAEAERAEAQRKAAEVKAAADLKAAQEKSKRDKDAAVVKERERVKRERQVAEDARMNREADQAHRDRIWREIFTDMNVVTGIGASDFNQVMLDAIMEGKIRHVKVVY